jgi:hypothetical protein
VGRANYGSITSSYATGSVSGDYFVGGLVGYANNRSTITGSYATGSVSGTGNNVGGLLGNADGSSIISSFWDKETTGQSESGGSEVSDGKLTSEMQSLSTFGPWDISAVGGGETTWRIYEGASAPLLRSFMQQVDVTASGSTREYDGTTDATLSDVSFSQTPVGLELSSGQFALANVGTNIQILPTYVATGNDSLSAALQRYDFLPITASITPKALSATASAQNKTYDGTTEAFNTTLWSAGP